LQVTHPECTSGKSACFESRAAPLASLRSSGRAAGLCGSARAAPLASLSDDSARSAPLGLLRSSGQAAGLCWFSSGQLVFAVCACRTPQSSGRSPSGLARSSLPPTFSDARSLAHANPTGIWLLSSVPHLWSSSFDCPASPGKEKTKCDRIAPSHPLSWPCVSDLLAYDF
jgi:hypothetical protein